MEIIPLSVEQAMDWLKDNARHYESKAKPLFAMGLSKDGELCGAAIMGTRDECAELCHIYSVGEYQGYTLLYGSMWRATKAMGYTRLIL